MIRRAIWRLAAPLAMVMALGLAGCRSGPPGRAAPALQPIRLTLSQTDQYQPLLTGRPQTCGMRSGRVVLAGGQECGWHSTNDHEEQLVVLSGQGVVLLEGRQPLEVAAGQIVYVPPHTRHNVRGSGPGPLRYIYTVAPVCRKRLETAHAVTSRPSHKH